MLNPRRRASATGTHAVVVTFKETIRPMSEIDRAVPNWPTQQAVSRPTPDIG
ncbi:MAG TPA: hypothetical protein VMH22_10165 [bacterium]|nr:hypothetical protein [bacterium]